MEERFDSCLTKNVNSLTEETTTQRQHLSEKLPLRLSEKTSTKLRAFAHYFMLIQVLLFLLPASLFHFFNFKPHLPYLWLPILGLWSKIAVFLCGADYQFEPQYDLVDTLFFQFYICASLLMSVLISTSLALCLGSKLPLERIAWWWRNLVRIIVLIWMIYYGFFKVFPVQPPPASLIDLLTRPYEWEQQFYMWNLLGASGGYQMVLGWIEIIGVILMVIPRFSIIGGIINLTAFVQIFLLIYFYDDPIRIIIGQLCIYELILIFPTMKDVGLYLIGKKKLIPHNYQKVVRVKSTFLRKAVIFVYLFSIIFYAGYIARGMLHSYTITKTPFSAPIAGVWLVDSVEEQYNDNNLNPHQWKIITIDRNRYSSRTEYAVFDSLRMTHDWFVQVHPSEIIVNASGKLPALKITYTISTKLVSAQSHLTDKSYGISPIMATFTIYNGANQKLITIIHARKYILPIGRPDLEYVDSRK